MPEVFTNLGLTTVSSGGTTAPVSGTVETWTVASSASFPAAVTGGSQFRVVEDDQVKQSEIILVTNVSGTTWTVTRGAEGTTPVAHTAGFTIVQTISKAVMDNWLQLDNTQTITGTKTFTNLTVTNLVVTGNTNIGNKALWSGTRNLPGALNNTVDIGTFSSTNGAFQVNMMLTVDAVGFIVTKSYELDVRDSILSNSTWYKVLPQDSTQNSGGGFPDFTLEVSRNSTTNAYTFRIRQTSNTGGTVYWQAEGYGTNSLAFSASTATPGLSTPPTTIWSPTPLYAGPGRVGINNDNPATELDVAGTVTVTNTTPTLVLTDGTRTGRVGVATAANDISASSAAGDLVLLTTNRVYVPTSLVSIGSISTLSAVSGTLFSPAGISGYTSTQNFSRYVGATTSGPPSNIGGSEAYSVGDWAVGRAGRMFVCTTAGTPGTWTEVGANVSAAATFGSTITATGGITSLGRAVVTHSSLATPMIQSGTFTVSFSAVAAVAGTAPNFAPAFSATPTIVPSIAVGSNLDILIDVTAWSTTNWSYRAFNKAGSNVTGTATVHWIAIGLP